MKLPTDKVQHLAVNAVGVLAGTLSGSLLTDTRTALLTAISLCIGLSVGKEYGDKRATGNHWCWWDLLADLLGIIFGTITIQTIIHFTQ